MKMPKKYIEAEEAKCIIEKLADELDKSSDIKYVFALTDAILKIDDVPAADVEEVRHGEWEDDADDLFWGNHIVTKHCSECGYTPEFDRETELFNLTKRCPECGAKMDGKREEQNE